MSTKSNLDYLMHFDLKTSLPNRLLLREQFEHLLATGEPDQQSELVPVMLMELENFGFEAAPAGNKLRERLLKELGSSLLRFVWGINNVTRIGPNRFAIFLSSPEPGHSTVDMLTQVKEIMEAVFEKWDLPTASPRTSIGVAFYPCDGTDLNLLIKKAELALLYVKARGGQDFEFFTAAMALPVSNLLASQAHSVRSFPTFNSPDVDYAPEPVPLPLVYRPQYGYTPRHLNGLEILVRSAPQGKETRRRARPRLLTVSELPMAGVANSSTLKWLRRGKDRRVTLGLTAGEIAQSDLTQRLIQTLRRINLKPANLALEISEEALFTDLEAARRHLADLRSLGIQLVLSNIEKGFTSLDYLDQWFRFDRLKINMAYLNKRFPRDRNRKKTSLATLNGKAQRFGMQVLVNEVESAEDLKLLEGFEWGWVQGSKLAPPLSQQKFEQLLPVAVKLPATFQD